jgi:F-type H+-transporting ATPase subunit b
MSATLLTALPTAASKSGGSFLVQPGIGLMVWTLAVFAVSMFILWKLAFPVISDALEKRQRMIEDSIDSAQKTKVEAEQLLSEYRERLKEARVQADEIVARAKKSGDEHERRSVDDARKIHAELLEQAKRDIESETKRATQDLRREVADLTVAAAEHVTRKTLNADDQQRLIDEALADLDFEAFGEKAR